MRKELLNKYIFVHSKDFWTSKHILDPFTNKDRDSPSIHVIILYWWKQNVKVWKSTKHLLFELDLRFGRHLNHFKVVPYTSGKIWSARLIFLFFFAVCLNISTVINIKILANSNQQTQSYKFTSHIAAFLSVVMITEMLEICIQTSYDQNVQLILKSYLPVMYGTTLRHSKWSR